MGIEPTTRSLGKYIPYGYSLCFCGLSPAKEAELIGNTA